MGFEGTMTPFTGIHDINARDKTRDWDLSRVLTPNFDATQQPVPSYQNPWELAQLVEIFYKKASMSYLELGPYHGGTLYWFLKAAYPGCKLAGVDFFDEKLGGRWKTPPEWQEWVKPGTTLQFFEGNTHDLTIIGAVREYFDKGLDFLFIDATHEYEDCRQEFVDYGAMMNPGGIICFHDIRPRNMGSHQLFEEVRQAGYVTQVLVADPYSTDVDAGIGVVYL